LSKQFTSLSIEQRDRFLTRFYGSLDRCPEGDNGQRVQSKNRQAERVREDFCRYHSHPEAGKRPGADRQNNPIQLADFPAGPVEQLLNGWRE
jgi:hypothetical protein